MKNYQLVLLVAFLAIPSTFFADEVDDAEEVIVVASRIPTLASDVIGSVESISSAELEAQMDLLVDAYECEWKQVVESEVLQERFTHFVNSDDRDDNIKFVPLRDQKMPELWE